MKIIAFILAVLVLSMAFVPCTDCNDVIVSETTEHAHIDSDTHHHSQNSEDGCTPFCVCQCCGSALMLPSTLDFTAPNESKFLYLFRFGTLYSFDYTNGVWHPPTLA